MKKPNTRESLKSRSLFGSSFFEGKNTYPQEYVDSIATELLSWKTYSYKILRKQEKLPKKLKDAEPTLTNEQLYFLGLGGLYEFCKMSKIFFQRTNLLIELCPHNFKWLEELIKDINEI